MEELASSRHRYRYSPVLTRDEQRRPGERPPHFSAAQLDELCPDWRDARSVGVRSAVAARIGRGALQRRRSRAGAAHRALPCSPRRRSGRRGRRQREVRNRGNLESRLQADATTPLLRVAEDAGLNPEHGCRMGICHTCDVPLVAGRVRDLRTSEADRRTGPSGPDLYQRGRRGLRDRSHHHPKQKELQR